MTLWGPNPFEEDGGGLWEHRVSLLLLKKATSSCRHPDDVAKEKVLYTEQVDLARLRLATMCADLGAVSEKFKGVA